jgi:Beta-galactosidase
MIYFNIKFFTVVSLIFFSGYNISLAENINHIKEVNPEQKRMSIAGKKSPDNDDYTLRYLLDAPAGCHGFVKINPKDQRLYFEDGTKATFFGVCMLSCFTNWNKKIPAKDIARITDELADMGVNLIRNHTVERQLLDIKTGDFHHPTIDNFDRIIYEAKKRGIYIHLNLNRGFSDRTKWGRKHGLTRKLSKKSGVARSSLILIDEFIDFQRDFAKKLLNHVNPYTKLAYKDEPAIISLQLGNEQHAYSRIGWANWSRLKSPYKEELGQRWNDFLKDKYKTQAALKRSWGKELQVDEYLAKATVKISNPHYPSAKNRKKQTPREYDAVLFGDKMQRRFHDIMRRTIRDEIGDKKHLISDNGWIRGDKLICKTAHEKLDMKDLQHYWPHGPRSLKGNKDAAWVKMSPSRDAGPAIIRSMLTARNYNGEKKAFMVTEFNSHVNNKNAWEIYPLHTLLLALTGGDGQAMWLYLFNKDGKKHHFGFNKGSAPLPIRLIPFVGSSHLMRLNISEAIDTPVLDKLVKTGKKKVLLSVDHQASFLQEKAKNFKNKNINLDFKNGLISFKEKNSAMYIGAGNFKYGMLKFSPKDKAKRYFFSAYALDGKDLNVSSRVRIFSIVPGMLKLNGHKALKAVYVNRNFRVIKELPLAKGQIKIDDPENVIFVDIFR